jgi:phospholipid/cholesterol/gamma-HCH transport system ATP-binding protein
MSDFFANLPKINQLKFEDLSFGYDGYEPVFSEIHFDFPMNEIVWIKAAQAGSGRSTLLQILAGLITPTKGKYFVNEQDVCEMSFEEFLPYRLSIGYSFDLGGLLHNRTLYENLMLPLMYHKAVKQSEANHLVTHYMQEMNILRYRDHRPSAVPGGIRKIVCLIRPLLMCPQVLLLDDPSLGVGQDTILKYFDLINNLRKQGLVKHIYVSSLDDKLMSLIEHTEIFIDQGSLLAELETPEKKVVHL